MSIIILKEDNREKFIHLIPPGMVPMLEEKNVFALGLLEHQEDGEHPMGIVISQLEEESAEILWIYVHPKLRGRGVGTKLMQTLLQILKQDEQIQTVMCFLEQNRDEIFFFLSSGFNLVPAHKGNLFETSVGALTNGKLGKQPVFDDVIPFSQVSESCLKDFNAMAQVKEMTSETISFPLYKEDYLPCSMAMVEKEEITGMLLFTQDEHDGAISMVFQYVSSGDASRIAMLSCAAVNAMKEIYSPETKVRLLSQDKLSRIIANTCATPAEESNLVVLTYEIKGGTNS